MLNVMTIGGASIDIIVDAPSHEYKIGAKHEVDHIGLYPGGGAVNTALCFASLGARVWIGCAVGADHEGRWFETVLNHHQIDVSFMEFIEGVPTSKAVIQQDSEGEVTVLSQRGASQLLSLTAACQSEIDLDLLFISSIASRVMPRLSEHLLTLNKRPFIAFNPAVMHLLEPTQGFKDLLRITDIICLNAAEAQVLAGYAQRDISQKLSLQEGAQFIKQLPQRSGQKILMTLGANGALYWDGQTIHSYVQEPVHPVSTLGAGDTFSSSFVYRLSKGDAPVAALKVASTITQTILAQRSANHAETSVHDMRNPTSATS